MKLFSHIAFTLLAAFLFSESVCAQESLPTIGRQSELVEGQTHLGIQVTNLTDKDLQAIERIGLDSGAGQKLIQFYFRGGGDTPLIGRVFRKDRILYFEPRFKPATSAGRLEFHIEQIRDDREEPIVKENRVVGSYFVRQSSLAFITPAQNRLPQNILRMYLQFTNPMQQGRSYEHIRFLDESGDKIETPYLEIPQELWSDDGTRLTLLFDPGRIKRGLDRHEKLGPPFVPNKTYTLEVSKDWPVAHLHPGKRGTLYEEFRHTFTITEPDRLQPTVDRWKMKAPQRDSREPLLLHFDEPLDVGMLQHSLQVLAVGKDVALPGEILANNEGLSWRFTPDQPWKPGQYLVAVNPRLEDRAGNSLAQPFEREIPEGETEPAALPEPKTTLRFEIAETPRDKPNVVVILADDLGFHDLSCTGSTFYESPNIDRICNEGIRFTQGYAACQVCSPSRAAIMTGKAPARLQITDYIGAPSGTDWKRNTKLLPAFYKRNLPLEETTIAEAFREEGYKTFFAGKWHLGSKGSFPEDHGFDVNVGGHLAGTPPGGFYVPYKNPKMTDGPAGECLPVRLGQEAADFIETNKDEPFFAFLSFYSVHAPIQSSEELWKKYRAKAEADEALSKIENRFLIDRTMPVRQVQDHPLYAGMVESMDDGVGKVLEALDRLGLAENTIVVFTSDNGGVSSGDGYATANLPLRGGKGRQWEGGIREPFFVRWPERVASGTSNDTPVIGTDLYPTLLDLCDLPPRPKQTIDGVSLRPILEGDSIDPRRLVWHYPHYGNQGGEPSSIIRAGDLKLIHYWEDDRAELYNLKDDPSEQTDLAIDADHKTVQWRDQLKGALDVQLKTYQARQATKNPNYDASAYAEWQTNMRDKRLPNMERNHARFRDSDFTPAKGWWEQQ